jgi:hemerythrin superfamily protein
MPSTRATSKAASTAKSRNRASTRVAPSAKRAGAPRSTVQKRTASGRQKAAPRNASIAVELLMSDHREVDALFNSYDREESAEGRRRVADLICGALAMHAQIEEQLFYPFVREQISATGLVDEAEVEHASLKGLITLLQAATNVDEKFDARVHVLKEYVKHHVDEEENEIFPKLKNMKPDLDELGQEMHQLKQSLLAETQAEDGTNANSIRRLSSGVPVLERPRDQR